MKKILCLILLLTLLAPAAAVGERFPAVWVNSEIVYSDELLANVKRHQIISALTCAEYGYAYDTVDELNLEDAIDKEIFQAQSDLITRRLLREYACEVLTLQERKNCALSARAEWDRYCAVVNSEAGMAFLPAGEYTASDDPEETVARYLNSFGLTVEWLEERARLECAESNLTDLLVPGMPVGGNRFDAYLDVWQACYDSMDSVGSNPDVIPYILRELMP